MSTVIVELQFQNGYIRQHVGPFASPDDASTWLDQSGALPHFRTMYVQIDPKQWSKP